MVCELCECLMKTDQCIRGGLPIQVARVASAPSARETDTFVGNHVRIFPAIGTMTHIKRHRRFYIPNVKDAATTDLTREKGRNSLMKNSHKGLQIV